MSMFTLQTLGLILLFGLIGLLIGWLIRSFFCKPGSGNNHLAGSAKGNTLANTGSGSADTSAKASVEATGTNNETKSGAAANTSAESAGLSKTAAAAAGVGAVAATAAAVAASAKDDVVESASELADSVSDAAAGAGDMAAPTADSVSGAMDAASGSASEAIDAVGNTASSTLDAAGETATDTLSAASSAVADTIDSAGDAVSETADAAKDMASGALDSTTGAIEGAAGSASELAGSATESVTNAAASATDAVSGSVDSAVEAASGAADSVSDGISGVAAAGLTGAAAVAAAAYSATGSSDDSATTDNSEGDSAGQASVERQDSVRQLREEAETMLRKDFTDSAAAYGANHVIIGAGPAGIVAAETIRKLDGTANVTVIGDEPEAPYSRMAIPYFLEENIQAEGTHLRKSENHYDDTGIEILSGRVKSVDTQNKIVETANGLQLPYDKLLIATGSHPLTPPIPGLDNPKVGNCWDLADSRKIIENVKPGSTVVQIGAGFIGCIILESLVKRGAKLTVVEMDNRMVPRMLDDQCGGMLKSWCESKGVTVLTETQVKSIEDSGDRIRVNLSKGDPIDADYVISATGVASNTDFLEGSGVEIVEGVLVNHHLETNVPGIYAAGDVAQGIDFTTGGYSVHAIQPTAADHGTISAKNMVRGNTTRHKGSLQMNILSTLDLISTSYGAWEGVEGGEHSELVDQDNYKYIRLQFKDDQLVGANTLGITQNIGALRGLIQNKTKLGVWKERLMDNPLHFMDAYVALTGNHA